MALYSGNLITGDALVAANYRRAMAPFSNFGTRQLAFLAVQNLTVNTSTTENSVAVTDDSGDNAYVYGTGDTYGINDSSSNVVVPEAQIFQTNSAIHKAISGVQLSAEVAMVGKVSVSSTLAAFVVGIYIDTAASANADEQHAALANTNARTIQAAVRAATGDSGVTVEPAYLNGAALTINGAEY
jgi:hypothetical protein